MKTAGTAATTEALDDEPRDRRAPAVRRRAATLRQAANRAGDPPINPLDRVIGYKLRRAQLVTFQEFIDFFARVKLRPAEYALIAVLEQQPGLSQTSAAKMLGIKRANFVSLLDSLERRGLAQRRLVHGDRRSRAIHLTDKGRQLAAKAEVIAKTYDDMLVERLGGTKERDRFLAMLDRLMTNG
jgi:DNA-binding MarR family transcriptional regulator